jgi:hypothetical protein
MNERSGLKEDSGLAQRLFFEARFSPETVYFFWGPDPAYESSRLDDNTGVHGRTLTIS